MKCHSCRLLGAPMWRVYPDGRREMVAPCCGPRQRSWRAGDDETGSTPDVAQWLRTRAVKVAWLIRAARNVPGLTVDRRTA